MLDVAEMVPGDIFLLKGGMVVPTDCRWVEGDVLEIDTAALTGEALPRKYPSSQYGESILSGCVVKKNEAQCVVESTGLDTEIGQAAAMIQEASGEMNVSLFESKILVIVKCIIVISLLVAAAIFVVEREVHNQSTNDSLLAALSLVIASVPVALPLVIQVTMALGAKTMADHKAIVTHLTALQEIASMTMLNSDKTGTLTTAKIQIIHEKIWCMKGYEPDDVLTFAAVCSNRANTDDAIDSAVVKSFDSHFGERAREIAEAFKETKFVGFNPDVKRTVKYCTHESHGQLKIGKGLVDKVLNTGDDDGDNWVCENWEGIREMVLAQDLELSLCGYKTIGVAVQHGEGPMRFVGIVPMLDPPRCDTADTIQRIRHAEIDIKMITGDHLNIAKETARLIHLGTRIHPNTSLWPASHSRDQLILEADGFAQVMPRDKREVVLVLQDKGHVVGMTGDGVNDAPALAQAQIGIAVADATDAARQAADIILTDEGLSAIFVAIVEARKIFQRLKSYVVYRIASTIQVVVVLSVMIFQAECTISSLYVILLALLNDLTMTPLAHDNATASKKPEQPSISGLLGLSTVLGICTSIQSLAFFYLIRSFGIDTSELGDCHPLNEQGCMCNHDSNMYIQTLMYLQISVSAELLIFAIRAPGSMFFSMPSTALIVLTQGASVLMSVLCATGVFGDATKLAWADVGLIWAYDLVWLVLIDFVKIFYRYTFEGTIETIDVDTPIERLQHSATGTFMQRISNLNSSIRSNNSAASTMTLPRLRRNLATGRTFMVRHEPANLVSKGVTGRFSAF